MTKKEIQILTAKVVIILAMFTIALILVKPDTVVFEFWRIVLQRN